MRRAVAVSLLLLVLLAGCASVMQMFQKDPAKVSLYTLKENFLEVRKAEIRGYQASTVSQAQHEEWLQLDEDFTLAYKTANNLRKNGVTSGPAYEDALATLGVLLLRAQKEYGGGK
jgi:hypothetical protein